MVALPNHSPKKRQRSVPKSIVEKPDYDVMEALFDKRVMREVDKLVPPPASLSDEDSEATNE